MASAAPRIDVSVHWPVHCRYRHAPGARCPLPGVWLVAGTRVRDAYPLVLLATRATS